MKDNFHSFLTFTLIFIAIRLPTTYPLAYNNNKLSINISHPGSDILIGRLYQLHLVGIYKSIHDFTILWPLLPYQQGQRLKISPVEN